MTSERWIRLAIGGACILAAVVALAAALSDDTPELTSDDARDFTEDALQSAGFEQVRVLGEPQRADYQRRDRPDDPPVPVWATRARIQAGRQARNVRLAIHRTEGVAVSLDEGRARFFTDQQFDRLNEYSSSEAVDRQQSRDTAGVIAAGLLVLVTIWLVVVTR